MSASTMNAFLDEIHSLRDAITALDDTITRIGQLSATSPDSAGTEELARLQAAVRASISDTAAGLRALRAPPGQLTHLDALRERLQFALAHFRRVQAEHRARLAQHVRRQIRIVNPAATEEEITRALDAGVQDGQIFQQALLGSSRSQAIAVNSAVQSRHDELLHLEQSVAEVAQLVNDLAILVEKQGEDVVKIETNAIDTEQNLRLGVEQQDITISWLQKNRRWMQIACFTLFLVLVVVVAIVALEVAHHLGKI